MTFVCVAGTWSLTWILRDAARQAHPLLGWGVETVLVYYCLAARALYDAAREILRYTGHETEIRNLLDKPTGPMNRAADNRRAAELLGWQPKFAFMDGLHRTIDWCRERATSPALERV